MIMNKTTIYNNDFYYIDSEDPVIHVLKNGQLFGLQNYALIKSFAKNQRGWIIDCGAHIGTFSFVPVLENKNVLMIEAANKNYECLENTFKKFKNSITEKAIVLDSVRSCEFSSDSGPFGSPIDTSSGNLTSDTIDNICDKHNIVDVSILKIDIEGFEGEALLGSLKILRSSKPVMLLEINGHCLRLRNKTPYYILKIIEDLDYYSFIYNNGTLIPIDKNQKFPFCVIDIVCIHKEHIGLYLGSINFAKYLQNNEIDQILSHNYNNSNEDCIKYFDSIK